MNSLFDVLHKAGLNYLKIGYDWRQDQSSLFAARQWDDGLDWSKYNRTFFLSSVLTRDNACLDDGQVRQLFKDNQAGDYLESVLDLLCQGRHMYLECFYCRKHNIRFMNNVHCDVLGVNNLSQAIRAGGIRRHDLAESEYETIIDGLNLGRGMTFKNFAARIPYGGNKLVVMMDPVDLGDQEILGFLAYALDRSRTFTGPDMGFPPELADELKNFSHNAAGGPAGPLGPTGAPTSFGVFLAAKQMARFKWGSEDLSGKKAAVMGLGAVGFHLAERYLKEGVSLVVADLDEKLPARLVEKYPDANIEVVKPDEILFVQADIFSPCAVGGVVTDEVIGRLKFDLIVGGANNLLRASGQEEEFRLANELKKKGILYQIDWWHNVGGVLCGCEEYEKQEAASMDSVLKKIEEICTTHTWKNLTEAGEKGITPTENAYRSAEEVIYRKYD